eukprot:TRINITY_DN25430_c0_g1_i1.p1 TRINITY_DN25430_c0_g1~~TRINITY_DN25430_c0_g1_i1.p1  ORF type:complete len:688 (-),score=118.04 TRINITY_DN25430_c0_g1_i1:76-2139(-)
MKPPLLGGSSRGPPDDDEPPELLKDEGEGWIPDDRRRGSEVSNRSTSSEPRGLDLEARLAMIDHKLDALRERVEVRYNQPELRQNMMTPSKGKLRTMYQKRRSFNRYGGSPEDSNGDERAPSLGPSNAGDSPHHEAHTTTPRSAAAASSSSGAPVAQRTSLKQAWTFGAKASSGAAVAPDVSDVVDSSMGFEPAASMQQPRAADGRTSSLSSVMPTSPVGGTKTLTKTTVSSATGVTKTTLDTRKGELSWNGLSTSRARCCNFNANARHEALEEAKRRRLWKLVHGSTMNGCVSLMILLNSVLIGYDADSTVKLVAFGIPQAGWLNGVDQFFSIFFVGELLLRAIAEKSCFLYGPEFKWNMFDCVLVSLGLVDLFLQESGGQLASMSVGRMLRLTRFFRLMRISRVMRHLQSLRLILFALLDSMNALCWCFVFIGFVIYVFAVIILYGVSEYFRPDDPERLADAILINDLKDWWGGLVPAMISLFMSISGGMDWADLCTPLKTIFPIYEYVYVFFIFFMCFGVLNVVVGAFVATTSQIAADDKEALVKSELAKLQKYSERIKGFFLTADVDKSGTLSWDEFRTHLAQPEVRGYFQALELDVSQAHMLFGLLDTDGSDQVTVEEFLEGCIRLKGQARSVDLNMLLFTCERMFLQLDDFMRWSESKLYEIEQHIDARGITDAKNQEHLS